MTFSPEKLTSYEAGFKSEYLQHRLRLNGAAYYYDYKDLIPLRQEGSHLWVCALVVFLMVLMNLRGVKESVLSLLPIFIAFIIMHVLLVGYALVSHGSELPTVFHAATREAHCRNRAVVWPYRAVVIAHRIVAALMSRERADAPSRVHVVGEQPFTHRRCAVAVD